MANSRRTCAKCGVEKNHASFANVAATVCRRCLKDPAPANRRRVCERCHTEKAKRMFASVSHTICTVCVRRAKGESADTAVREHKAERLIREDVERQAAVELRKVGKQRKLLRVTHTASDAERELAARVLCRRRLLPFTQRFNPDYQAGWVHHDVCRRLERFATQIDLKRSPRLMLLMPPRTGKSELASRNFPAWFLGARPKLEVVAGSYSGALTLSFSRKVREIVRDSSFTPVFDQCKLDPSSQALESWMTTQGGSYTAVGVGGSLTGKGAHCLIIDDPVKDQLEADSQTIRDNIFDWYVSTARTRLAPGGGLLLIQTWWNDDDLAGRLQAAMSDGGEQFEVVYPGEEPSKGARLLRAADSALHPERYDYASLIALKGAYEASGKKRIWSALYQQNPMPDDGLYFTKDLFEWYDDAPDLRDARIIQAWDFAITEKQNSDWTVGVCIAQTPDDDLYLLNIVETMLDFHEKHGAHAVGVEDGQIWKTMKAIFERRCRERRAYPNMITNRPVTDKQVRASPLRGRMQGAKVHFPRKRAWVDAVEAELLRFPAAKHDDIVDALAWSVQTALVLPPPPARTRHKPREGWRDKLKIMQLGEGGLSHMAS